MEHNEINMFMDVKLDIGRAHAQKFKTWTKCQVKIEAVKCVPCFLRLTFQRCVAATEESGGDAATNCLTVSINVPGVSISLATSRTKEFSYGLFWAQNRRDCFIYFALDTEASCRQHMKWIKKSIKNLELYRQVFLEQRRLSRGPSRLLQEETQGLNGDKLTEAANGSAISTRTSRVSEIYEEIFEGYDHARLSRRHSRGSIASGIYEEMKPITQNFKSIIEEPPALPPLPPHRKRINTFDNDNNGGGLLVCELQRSNTNPESELAKKKKYKNMLDNIFGGVGVSARQKRAESVSECEQQITAPFYENVPPSADCALTTMMKRPEFMKKRSNIEKSQRNSFSSPDLSQLNYFDNNVDVHSSESLLPLEDSNDYLNLSLDESAIQPTVRNPRLSKLQLQLSKADSLESLNISEQLPHNFNFSACNTSTINLIGSHGAVPQSNVLQKNKILVDDLTGYCVMAPIVNKKTTTKLEKPQITGTESTSSGYSTGSYCSSTSSCNTDEQQQQQQKATIKCEKNNESDIYESMVVAASFNGSSSQVMSANGFAEHLYENLLAVKAAQELEQPGYELSTSTPTDSPLIPALPQKGGTPKSTTTTVIEEDFYQTPRKSIISIDDKIPSYYPNSCDTMKSKRHRSPERTPKSDKSDKVATTGGGGLRNLVNVKIRRERKENHYITSPKQVNEARPKSENKKTSGGDATKTLKTQNKKPAAQKIADNVYAVTHAGRKATNKQQNGMPAQATASAQGGGTLNNNNDGNFTDEMKEKIQTELRQLALLQNIDFKFDDSESTSLATTVSPVQSSKSAHIPLTSSCSGISAEDEYEYCYQAAESATRLLQKYATLAKYGGADGGGGSSTTSKRLTTHSVNETTVKQKDTTVVVSTMTQSVAAANSPEMQIITGNKKFASLPRFKKIDFSPLRLRINNVLQRHSQQQQTSPASTKQQQTE